MRATARRPPVVLLAGVWCDFAECALHGSLHPPHIVLVLETGDAHACACTVALCDSVNVLIPLVFPRTCTCATAAVTQRSLIPTLNSTPPSTTCGVCAYLLSGTFAHSGSSLARPDPINPPSHALHGRRTCSTYRPSTQHPQVRDSACPPRALLSIEICVYVCVCALSFAHSRPPSPLSRLARGALLY